MRIHESLFVLIMFAGCGKVDESSPPDAPQTSDASVEIDADIDASPDCPAELCDGEDDDCDGKVDDGCPQTGTITLGTPMSLALIGDTTTHGMANTPFDLHCGAGDAIIGFTTSAYESIDQLGIVCAHVRIASDGVIGAQRTYTVTVSGSIASALYGGTGGTPTDSTCASGVAIAAALWEGEYMTFGKTIFGLAYICSNLAISGLAGDAQLQPMGPRTESTRIGTGNANVPASRKDAACPTGSVLTGVTGYYGPWPLYQAFTIVNGLQFQCSSAQALLEP